jgi:hypothetical protein
MTATAHFAAASNIGMDDEDFKEALRAKDIPPGRHFA